MSRRLAMLASLTALALAAFAPSASATIKTPIQLSLGDSWGFGVGAADPATGGYVPRLHETLTQEFDCTPNLRIFKACRTLELRNISVGGATTPTLIAGQLPQAQALLELRNISVGGATTPNLRIFKACRTLELRNISVGGATTPTLIAGQLPQAQALLAERNTNVNTFDDVKIITVSIGGNDVFNPIVAACVPSGPTNPVCAGTILSELGTYQADLTSLLSALRTAAGPSTRIVLGTYDNAIVGACPLASVPGGTQLGAGVLEGFGPGTGPLENGLHDVMRGVAPAFGVEIAEVNGDLNPATDWAGDCLHPNDSGYVKVAAAFADTLVN